MKRGFPGGMRRAEVLLLDLGFAGEGYEGHVIPVNAGILFVESPGFRLSPE